MIPSESIHNLCWMMKLFLGIFIADAFLAQEIGKPSPASGIENNADDSEVTVSCGLSRSEGPPLFIAIVEPYLITLRGRTNEVPLYMASVTLFTGIVIRH